MTKISSPCIMVCVIDETTRYCFGCGRTQLEINDWSDYKEEKRLQIMATLDARLKNVKHRPRRQTRRQKLAEKSNNPAMNTPKP